MSVFGRMTSSSTSSTQAIPVITVGGFLGAGKTTMVNHLLSQSDGRRIVVFVNDFGAINIDYDLIETVDTDRVSLTNGCVCCSLNDDLIASISEFCSTSPPDAFVVEASGVADPRTLDQSIMALQSAGRVTLSCRVYVLDADQFGSLDYADTEQIVDHAVASDLVLINKWDLADESTVRHVEALLQRSAPQTIMKRTQYAKVPLSELFDSSTALIAMPSAKEPLYLSDPSNTFTSWSCENFAPISRANMKLLIGELCSTALRAKGILYFDDAPDTPMKFDFVGKRHGFAASTDTNDDVSSTFVVIGWNNKLNVGRLSEYLVAVADHPNITDKCDNDATAKNTGCPYVQ